MTKVGNYYQYHLINESVLELSKMFLNLLKSIKKDKIAASLLELWEKQKDHDFVYNFIDISDKKDIVSFTPDKKIQELLGKTTPKEDIIYTVVNDGKHLIYKADNATNMKIFNILGFKGQKNEGHIRGLKGKIKAEYRSKSGKTWALFVLEKPESLPPGAEKSREHVLNKEALQAPDEETERKNKIWSSARSNIKIGRIARALIEAAGEKIADKDVENFVNKFKSAYDILNNSFARFNLVQGKDISYWYNSEHYQNSNGSLGGSCMSGVDGDYFDIYVKNPEVCNLLVLYSEGGELKGDKYSSKTICGRALIWKTDEGEVVMDRIYSNFDNDINLFRDFAVKNKWWYKTAAGYSGSDLQVSNGSVTKTPVYVITLKKTGFDNYPYMDTFFYMNSSDKKLSNDKEIIDADRMMNDTGGSYENLDGSDDDDY